MRASAAALRAYPQTIVPPVQIYFGKVHGRPVVEAPRCGNHFQIISMSVLACQEISTRDAVVDEATGLRTSKHCSFPGVLLAVGKVLLQPHLHVVLITKCAKCLAWLVCRHTTSFTTHFNSGSRGCGTRRFPQVFEIPTPIVVFLRLLGSAVKRLLREKILKTNDTILLRRILIHFIPCELGPS